MRSNFVNCFYPTHLNLTNISLGPITMFSTQDGWMVGDIHSKLSSGSTIVGNDIDGVIFLHYAQGQWQQAVIPLAASFKAAAIYPVSSQESWILGTTQTPASNGACCDTILHEQNDVWATEAIPSAYAALQFDFIAPAGPDDAWFEAHTMAFDYYLIHEQHGTWTEQELGNDHAIYDIHMLSAQGGWAVGAIFGPHADQPYMLHYNGTAWQPVSLPSHPGAQPSLFSISLDAPDDGWAVGISQQHQRGPIISDALFYHFTHGVWQQVPVTFPSNITPIPPPSGAPFVDMSSVTAVAPDDAWAIITAGILENLKGSLVSFRAFIFHYDGQQWKWIQH